MAEEEKKDEAEGGDAPKKSKAPLLIGGGVICMIAAGAAAAMLALPSKEVKPRMMGPFALSLYGDKEQCVVNLAEPGRTRFLQMKPQATFMAYDPLYMDMRITDTLYKASLDHTIFGVVSRKKIADIWGNEIDLSAFAEELRDRLAPILFPVHLGNTLLPWDIDEPSGLQPGLSSSKNTFRGAFEDHLLHLDQTTMEMWVDNGPKTTFKSGDSDVRLITEEGTVLYISTSHLKEDFEDEVKIGVRGRMIQIVPADLKVQ